MVLLLKADELIAAKKLMRESKYEEALGTIKLFENKVGITDEEKLSALILEGKLYLYIGKLQEAIKVGEFAYNISQKLRNISGTIEALLLKSNITFLGDPDECLKITQEAENLIDKLEKETSSKLLRERAANLYAKAWGLNNKGDYNAAMEPARLSLSLRKKLGKKLSIALTLRLVGHIYDRIGEPELGLDYAMESLELQKELNYSVGIAMSLQTIGNLYLSLGEINKAILFNHQALEVKQIDFITSFVARSNIGRIYGLKGELDQALKHYKQALAFSAGMGFKHPNMALNWVNIGTIYRMKGDYKQAVEFFKRNLESTDWVSPIYLKHSLFYLVLINLDLGLLEEAKKHLILLKEESEKLGIKLYNQTYQIAKALVLKASGLTRNRFESEKLLKHIAKEEVLEPEIYIISLVSLCKYLLEELESSNNLEIISEINPVITRLLEIAEKQHSYSIQAEVNLLQGRLALMTLKLNDARHFLTTAQKIADDYGLSLFAQEISYEHDNLLEELETWQSFKEKKVPVSKRMRLAAVDGVMERMLGKRAIEPADIVEEEPILLLIMDNNGATYFNHPFIANWDHSDLFSLFLSAFNTFSDEIFSKSIDRIRIGENTILIDPVEPFLTCYVIKGQSYLALQKLTRFTEAIRGNSEIWQSLNKSVKTSEMLELEKPSALKTVINEIFS
jgi:tetratricopeptide (TPR) repeat protein